MTDNIKNQEKVSIITPSYNSEKYIKYTIESVQKQTYQNWEMIIVDDCSTDNTKEIVKKYMDKDERIILLEHEKNQGAAKARNKALRKSSGRYIAYLDADDVWLPDKLEYQVKFMNDNNYGFSCASYEVISEEGNSLNKIIKMKKEVDYIGFLTNNLLQTVGIMADTKIINKKDLVMPDLRRRQDAATWLQVLKSGHSCYGIKRVLCQYRRVSDSLSSNHLKAVKGIWYLYRKVERLSLPFSCYCFVRYAVLAVWKRVYPGGRK